MTIPLRWINNTVEHARSIFSGGKSSPEFTYFGAPILTDFELNYENLAPFVTEILDQAASLEAAGINIALVEIKYGQVKIW